MPFAFLKKRPVRAADHHRLVDAVRAVDVLLHDLLGTAALLDDFLTIIGKIPRPVEIAAFKQSARGEVSGTMRGEIANARAFQQKRLDTTTPFVLNARLPENLIRRFCRLGGEANSLLVRAQKQLRISARGRSHILRVARTIADLEGASEVAAPHVAEAIQYRMRELPV